MKKSILALFLCAIMLYANPVSAISTKDYLTGLGFDTVNPINVAVDANVKVRKSGTSDFIDGPINVTKKSSDEWPTFDFCATINMEAVREEFEYYSDSYTAKKLIANFDQSRIYGSFVVSATYPATFSVPESFIVPGSMEGFNDAAKAVFKEVDRAETSDGNFKTLNITLAVKDPTNSSLDYITQGALASNLSTYLPDFTLTCEGVKTSKMGTFKISGKVSGDTFISESGKTAEEGKFATIHYDAIPQDVTVAVTSPSSQSGGATLLPDKPGKEVIVSFSVAGDTTLVESVEGKDKVSVNIETIKKPEREGFMLDGWYADENYKTKLSGIVDFTEDAIIYAKWINIMVPEMFDATSHYAYLNGYEDGKIYPERPISREEVSAVLHRLLTADFKSTLSAVPVFNDVSEDRWSAEAIFAMADGDFLKGYPDGTFDPAKPVTRAEFATIISRFYKDVLKANHVDFKDIGGHWAEEYIKDASSLALIEGYEDGTFKPDAYVSRAEAVTIINRILVRYVDDSGLCEGVKMWPDNSSSSWYYYQIIEASNAHAFTRREDGIYETWTGLTK